MVEVIGSSLIISMDFLGGLKASCCLQASVPHLHCGDYCTVLSYKSVLRITDIMNVTSDIKKYYANAKQQKIFQ